MKGIHCPNKACKRQVGVIRDGGVHITCPRCKGDVLALTQVGIKDSEGMTRTVYVEKPDEGGIRVIGQSERLPWTREEQEAYGDLAAWFMNRFKGQMLGVANQSSAGYMSYGRDTGTEIMCPLQDMRGALETTIGNGRFWLRVFPEFGKGINDDGSPYARCYCRVYIVDRPEVVCGDDIALDVLLGSSAPGDSRAIHWQYSGLMTRGGVIDAPSGAVFVDAKRLTPHRWLITAQEDDGGCGVPQEWELVASYVGVNPRFYRVK